MNQVPLAIVGFRILQTSVFVFLKLEVFYRSVLLKILHTTQPAIIIRTPANMLLTCHTKRLQTVWIVMKTYRSQFMTGAPLRWFLLPTNSGNGQRSNPNRERQGQPAGRLSARTPRKGARLPFGASDRFRAESSRTERTER